MRTLARAVLPLLLFAALAPAVASAQSPGVGGYAGTAPATAEGTEDSGVAGTSESGVAGTSESGVAAGSAGSAPSKGTLPFTGAQLALIIVAGLGALGLGFALRRSTGPGLPGA